MKYAINIMIWLAIIGIIIAITSGSASAASGVAYLKCGNVFARVEILEKGKMKLDWTFHKPPRQFKFKQGKNDVADSRLNGKRCRYIENDEYGKGTQEP